MSDEDIDASKAPLIEHLVELRQRLMKSVIAIILMFIVCFYFATDIYNILTVPYLRAAPDPTAVQMIFTAPQEWFFTQLKLALFGALFLAFPVVASQIYMFVAPGLYKEEKGAFLPFLVATPILFAIGACLVYFLIMPMAMGFFLSMEQTGGEGQVAIQHLAKVSEYLGLIMVLIFAFGLVFQLPVVLTLLGRTGLVSSEGLKDKRKYAIVAAFAAAAILTPPDPISQIGLALPTLLLYEVSIISVRLVERKRAAREEAREAEEA
ncbi:twin-arginine translocase subunit TatC [Roseibium polysiphoniae]|uniref:Sec-independent protein translocase protein TatC n=1 Tax=Roseibium polysiphoniae TaxID=2571221 RepID=A0A927Q5W6_9HYPH|nr:MULTISPECIES: twin-arginine translocase subunit TatC [Stappiaceae]MBD8878768.1 twin-arginine translocase subunit TatC [Roseibium polysiphoniae]MBS8259277.1 twin-arginine translocase subunit TatC [Roseibium polysiphoniae]